MVKVHLEVNRCEAHGLCEELAPDQFVLREDGTLDFPLDGQELPEALEAKVVAAALACPVAALKVLRDK